MAHSFNDIRGTAREVRVTLPVFYQFCREHKLGFNDLGEFSIAQLLDIAFLASRHQAAVKVHGETFEEFLASLDGAPFGKALEAIGEELADFTQRLGSAKPAAETKGANPSPGA